MKYIFAIFILSFMLLSGCAWRDNYFDEYNDFAIKSARMGLWNEAIMRWESMAELHPEDARIRNNLAVAYEAKGELDMAMEEYRKAIELDPGNRVYQKNYLSFRQRHRRPEEKSSDKSTEEKSIEDIMIQEDDSEDED